MKKVTRDPTRVRVCEAESVCVRERETQSAIENRSVHQRHSGAKALPEACVHQEPRRLVSYPPHGKITATFLQTKLLERSLPFHGCWSERQVVSISKDRQSDTW